MGSKLPSSGIAIIGVLILLAFAWYVISLPPVAVSSVSAVPSVSTPPSSAQASATPSDSESLLPSVSEAQRYSFFSLAGNPVTVEEQRSADGRNLRYQISGDADANIIVFVPKSEAASASDIQVVGTYDVLEDDPIFQVRSGTVLKFKNPVQASPFTTMTLSPETTNAIRGNADLTAQWLSLLRQVSALPSDEARAISSTLVEIMSDSKTPVGERLNLAAATLSNFRSDSAGTSTDGLPSVPNPVLIASNLAPFGTAYLGPVDEDLGEVLNIGPGKNAGRMLLSGKLAGLDVNDYATLRMQDKLLFIDVNFVPYLQAAQTDAEREARLIQLENVSDERFIANLYYSGKADRPERLSLDFRFYSINPTFEYALLDAQKATVTAAEGLALPAQELVFSCTDVSDFLQSATQELAFESQADLARVDYAADLAKSKSYVSLFTARLGLQFSSTGKEETCHVAGEYVKADVQFRPGFSQAFLLTYDGSDSVKLETGFSASDDDALVPPGSETGVPVLVSSSDSGSNPAT